MEAKGSREAKTKKEPNGEASEAKRERRKPKGDKTGLKRKPNPVEAKRGEARKPQKCVGLIH